MGDGAESSVLQSWDELKNGPKKAALMIVLGGTLCYRLMMPHEKALQTRESRQRLRMLRWPTNIREKKVEAGMMDDGD